jgi:hypothetical protein
VAGLGDEIEALHMIFAVNERAMFEFVVTEASLREVVNRRQPGYTRWVLDVLDTWLIQSEGDEPPTSGTTFRGASLRDDQREGRPVAVGGSRLAL